MAVNNEAQKQFQAHQNTYAGFLSFCKVGTIAVVLVTAFVVVLIAN